MPAQAIPELLDIPTFKHLTLYTGNVMKTSVAGRNKILCKKSNTEVSFFLFYFVWSIVIVILE